MFAQVIAASALVASTLGAFSNETVVTTDITVTDYTTYCPYSTVLTVSKPEGATTITVSEATTITVTGECVVPTTYTTSTVGETVTVPTSSAPSTVAAVSSFEGAGNKMAAGAFAGVAAVAAALI